MKTAEEWDNQSQLTINKNERLYRLEIYRQCQLDAAKWGAKQALNRLIDKDGNSTCCGIEKCNHIVDIKYFIATNLTIDQLPK